MATDVESLLVQFSADFKQFDRAMSKANGIMARQIREIERNAAGLNKRLDSMFASTASRLTAPLAGIGAALGTREILRYADAWTSAKNSLAVAGVIGQQQKQVLDQLYQSAQANAAPITALTDLYGKAAQASDNLGASQSDMLKFSDGVAVALRVAGTSASQASGALTQLGQLLGQARVQAEEFNSVNEGARPILMAVANGLDAAGGSVSKLKALVTDGKVSGQQFFQAFLRGLPTIQSMAANATQTIEQGITKVNNAFTKYIGETDESLGASQRLVEALNAIADNFDHTADVVLKLAGIIAGALVGRSIVLMIRNLGLATTAIGSFVTALRTASSVSGLAAALGGIGAAAGPIGLLVGGTVVTALTLFSSSVSEASSGARTYAEALAEVEAAAKKVPPAITGAGKAISNEMKNSLSAGVAEGVIEIGKAKSAVEELFSYITQSTEISMVSEDQLRQLRDIKERFDSGALSADGAKNALFALANSDPNFQAIADSFKPLLDALQKAIAATDILRKQLGEATAEGPTFRQLDEQSMDAYREMKKAGDDFLKEAQRRNALTKDQLSLETEIAKVRKGAEKAGVTLTDKQIREQAASNIAADTRRTAEGKKPKRQRKTPGQRFDDELQRSADRTSALIAETEAQRQINPLINDYGYAMEKARTEQELLNAAQKAGVALTPELRAQIAQTADQWAYASSEAEKLAEAQNRVKESAEEMASFQKDLVGGIASDLLNGASAADVFANALGKIADKLLEIGLNSIFDVDKGGFNLFGALGGIFRKNGGPVKRAGGGIVRGPGGPRGDKIPAMLSDEEFVVNAAATKRNRALLEAINSGGVIGLKDGGSPLRAPSMPILKAPSRQSAGGAMRVDVGVSVDNDGNLQAYVQNVSRKTSQTAIRSYDKTGPARLKRDSRQANMRGMV